MGTTDKARQEILRQRLDRNEKRGLELNREITRLAHKEQGEKRKEDTRRKILIGANIMQEMDARPDKIGAWVMNLLDKKLWKPQDRALFDLPVLAVSETPPAVAKLGVGTADGLTTIPVELNRAESAKEQGEKPKADTRRKILIGAVVMTEMEAHPDKIGAWGMNLLDKKLWKPQDRKLFGLAPLEQSDRPGPVAKLGVGTLAAGEDGPAITPFQLQIVAPRNASQPSRPDGSETSRTAQERPPLSP